MKKEKKWRRGHILWICKTALFLPLLFSQYTFAQLTINYAAADYAANFLAGEGITISNPSFSGSGLQLATFGNGGNYIGFNEGVILTTGDAAFAATSNTSNRDGQQRINVAGMVNSDPDLSQLQGNLRGVGVLEFDLVSTGTLLEFEFVFGSEEYEEYVGSTYNDVFGFFISGPGINGTFSNGAKNIALVPNSNDFISVNTVNRFQNSQYFINNFGPGLYGPGTFVYDGYTKTMKVSCPIQCGQTYHLRIAISNVRDQLYDSGVMLKKGSMRSSFQLDEIHASPQPICEGQDLTLSIQGEEEWSYTWSDGQSGVGLKSISTISSLSTSSYAVTVTNEAGCSLSRSIDVNVHADDDQVPYIKGANNSGEYSIFVPANEQICFTVSSFDRENERVSITATNLPDGAIFEKDQGIHETGQFCWLPTGDDIGLHQFGITVRDNNNCEEKEAHFKFSIKVACEFCPGVIYYENRSPAADPLPIESVAGQKIVAGESVDPSQPDGVVTTGATSVEFRAPKIILQPGFIAGPNFYAKADEESCIKDCEDCCENWTGFTYDFIPNVITPNGDGINDIWYIPDSDNPFCAFNAQEFDLKIKNRWGLTVKRSSVVGNRCCPFEAPSSHHYINHSSIYWDGRTSNGNFVSDGVYTYILTLKSCGFEEHVAGTIYVYGSSGSVRVVLPEQESNEEIIKVGPKTMEYSQPNHTVYEGVDKVVRLEYNAPPSIHPNPISSQLYLELVQEGSLIEVLATDGRILHRKIAQDQEEILDLRHLSNGVYLVRITSGQQNFHYKIIKQ